MFSPLGNVDLIPIQIVNKCPKENAPNHQEIWGGPGGGLPEYPGFHLKEAILVPIVLLAVVQYCTQEGAHTHMHCNTYAILQYCGAILHTHMHCCVPISIGLSPSPSLGYRHPAQPPTPPWGETTHGRPSAKLDTTSYL